MDNKCCKKRGIWPSCEAPGETLPQISKGSDLLPYRRPQKVQREGISVQITSASKQLDIQLFWILMETMI